MIVVRDMFQLHFGKAKDALEHLKKGRAILAKHNYPASRVLSDLSGTYYTITMESEFDSLAAFETAQTNTLQTQEWRSWYESFIPFVHTGKREICRLIEG